MENTDNGVLIVNETPHHPITIQSYRHLLEFAQSDNDIAHPLGMVYRAKIAHPDNMVRIVVLRDHRLPYDVGMGAFIFDKEIWSRYRNPFSSDYNATRTLLDDNMGVVRGRLTKAYRPVIARVKEGVSKIRGRVASVRNRNLPRMLIKIGSSLF